MKKIFSIIFLLFTFSIVFSQTDYFLGTRTYCKKPTDARSVEIYDLGLKCIRENLYTGAANQIFNELIKKDSTFCDAYFLAGYTLRLSNMNKEAVVMYYMADSLAQNRSIEFKQNLATVSMLVGHFKLSRKKYEEMTTYFPESPEGYFGIALTSTLMGDVDYGLKNINIAEEKYKEENKDCQSLKAILLSFNEKYEEAIPYFEKVETKFSKDDAFNGAYALSLNIIGRKTNDEKMIKRSKKYYNKVKNKEGLTEKAKEAFKES